MELQNAVMVEDPLVQVSGPVLDQRVRHAISLRAKEGIHAASRAQIHASPRAEVHAEVHAGKRAHGHATNGHALDLHVMALVNLIAVVYRCFPLLYFFFLFTISNTVISVSCS